MFNQIHLFDTYQKGKKLFVPLEPGKVKIYTCGPTVYDYPHIGNLRAYIFSDILRRMFEFNGYEVRHVINITDVGHLTSDADSGDDKMELSAQKQKRSAFEIAEFYTAVFKQNLLDLNIKVPAVWSRATDHIQDQINLVMRLQEAGYTYLTSDGVYFDTSHFSGYGHLARLDLEGLMAGARVEMSGEKKNPADFALWKFSSKDKTRQMEWQSPWGVGFPGWHVECSAMAMKYLGETLDVHTGGIDHIPVHHTNEIAQSEAVTGKQFARYWLHVEFLTVNGQKMSKSTGTFIKLQDVIDRGYDPLALRYLALTSHYRAGLNFTWENLRGAQKALTALREKIAIWPVTSDSPDQKFVEEFARCVNNDVNTPQALAVLFEVTRSSRISEAGKRATILEFEKVLTLGLERSSSGEVPEEIKILVQEREVLRQQKKWKDADRARQEILQKGYEIKDTPNGVKVTRKGT